MATVRKFEDLEIWQLAWQLYKKMSTISEKVREKKDFRFADQIKSAAGSIMDNIAEGFDRNSRLEFINSLTISKGECGENKSQLYKLLSDNYINESEFDELYGLSDKLSGKIASFVRYLNKTEFKGLKYKERENRNSNKINPEPETGNNKPETK